MPFFADLHVHSHYSRATSKLCDLENLAFWGARKGLAVVGTGDLTHPAWRAELTERLVSAEPGLYRLADEAAVAERLAPSCSRLPRFMATGEISTIYKADGRTRKVHHLVHMPALEAAARFSERLGRVGNIVSDGRPILGLDSRDLLEMVLETDDNAYLVPAHIWTPWFSVLGSRSGFDSVEACYRDLAGHVFALETGLSSDPPMNWGVSALDRFHLVSHSDAHSPAKLGREATAFACGTDYFAMRRALGTGEGYAGTVEFFPEQGKYHLDGHRKCRARLTPEETRALEGCCPVCGDPVTIGVLHRVRELADRTAPAQPPATAGTVRSLVPLAEVLAEVLGVGAASKTVLRAYGEAVDLFGPELSVLQDVPVEDIRKAGQGRLADALKHLREGQTSRHGGYDGVYGTVRLLDDDADAQR